MHNVTYIFREKRSKLSNLANVVYADVSYKEAGKTARIVKQNSQNNSQTSQKDFILITHSKSVDYRTVTIQVIESKYHERLIDS